jgi:uncharacterized protein (DUF433 family)
LASQEVRCYESCHSGQPSLEGTRLTVLNVVSFVDGDSLENTTGLYEELTEAGVASATEYCRDRICLVDRPDVFCSGCVYCFALSSQTWQEFMREAGFVCEDEIRDNESVVGAAKFIGTREELVRELKGVEGWKIAQRVHLRYLQRLGLPHRPPRKPE